MWAIVCLFPVLATFEKICFIWCMIVLAILDLTSVMPHCDMRIIGLTCTVTWRNHTSHHVPIVNVTSRKPLRTSGHYILYQYLINGGIVSQWISSSPFPWTKVSTAYCRSQIDLTLMSE